MAEVLEAFNGLKDYHRRQATRILYPGLR